MALTVSRLHFLQCLASPLLLKQFFEFHQVGLSYYQAITDAGSISDGVDFVKSTMKVIKLVTMPSKN